MAVRTNFIGRVAAFSIVLAALAAPAFASVIRITQFSMLNQIGKSSDYPLDGNYEFFQDIDASESRTLNDGLGFEPIGTYDKPFTGTFNGRGYYIGGLYINRPQTGYVGFFGHIGKEARVSGLGFRNIEITGSYAVGTLAGGNDGTVTNCYATGTVHAERLESNAGGLVGVNGGTINRSYSMAAVSGSENVGGLTGLLVRVADGVINESYAGGAVTGVEKVGGLVGYIFGGTITNSYSMGRVIGARQAGGLVGADHGSASASYRTMGTVSARGATGGDIGPAVVSGAFWDVGASQQAASAAGTGRSTEDMKRQNTFAGWNFSSAWMLSATTQYPVLREVPVNAVTYEVANNGMIMIEGYEMQAQQVYGSMNSYTLMQREGVPGPNVTARGHGGYRFHRWNDGSTEQTRSDAAADGTVFTAEFVPDTFMFEYVAGEGGSLRVGSSEETVPRFTITAEYLSSLPHIAAVADSGYFFSGWSDGGTSHIRADMADYTRNMTFTAAFTPGDYVPPDTTPIPISSLADLAKIGNDPAYPMNGHYVMTGDIDASSSRLTMFIPIGGTAMTAIPFTGKFNGGGYTILELYINTARSNAANSRVGLFRSLGATAVVDGVNIVVDTIVGMQMIGTLAGANSGTIKNCSVTARQVRSTYYGNVGGLTGSNSGIIVNCFVKGQMSSVGYDVGGLTGVNSGTISESYSDVHITGIGQLGGLAGVNSGRIRQCFSMGSVNGAGVHVGGLVGSNSFSNASIIESYSAVAVTNDQAYRTTTGGLVGISHESAEILASYWNITVSGQTASAGGAGLIDDLMKQQSTFSGWDFTGVWTINPEQNNGYPYLRGMGAPALGKQAQPTVRENSANAAVLPKMAVYGKVLTIRAPENSDLRIRLFDVRGKTVARYNVNSSGGLAKISLNNIPSGKYIVEVRDGSGKRVINKSSFVVRN